jgi:ribosomal protein S18 acetylase RimI-like enzyme
VSIAVPPLWRLTRNPYAKRVHEALDAVGVTVSVLQVYARTLASPSEPDTSVRLRYHDPGALADARAESFRDADALGRADRVVAAYADGTRVGSVLLTVDKPVYVDALHRQFDPGGAYVWRLYVAPAARGRGLGKTLVRAALWAATETNGPIDRAAALIAPDNVPSQAVFEAVGFDAERELRYLRALGRERRTSHDLAPVSGAERSSTM